MLRSFTSTACPEINNMSTEYTYKYSRAAVGYLAEIFDPSGKKLAEAIGFGKKDAKKQVQKAAGILNSNSNSELTPTAKSRKPRKKPAKVHSLSGRQITPMSSSQVVQGGAPGTGKRS